MPEGPEEPTDPGFSRGGPSRTEGPPGTFPKPAASIEPGLRPSGPGVLLLCTDGLTRYLSDPEDLRAAIPPSGAEDALLPAARGLVEHDLSRGGHDNVTALVLPVTDGAAGARGG